MSGQPSYLGVATAGWVAALKSSDSLERRLAAHALAEIGCMAKVGLWRQFLGAESHALDDPGLGHPTSNTAVVGRCRPADQSPPTGLD